MIAESLLPLLATHWLSVVSVVLLSVLTWRILYPSCAPRPVATPSKVKSKITDPTCDDEGEEEQLEGLVDPGLPEDLEHVPLVFTRHPPEVNIARSAEFYQEMQKRRSVRMFSSDPVPRQVIDNIIRTAGTAPSGAHTEPWSFVAIQDQDVKQRLREVVEAEEEVNYTKRMGAQWVRDLKGLRTTWVKEYLTEAPWILVVFKKPYEPLPDGRKRNHYYHEVSTALSGGILLAAIQYAGLVTLTSTPLNCGPTIRALLQRPSHEKLMLLLPLGYPHPEATVPDLARKPLDQILTVV